MKQFTKRIIISFLAAVLICSCVSTVFAQEGEDLYGAWTNEDGGRIRMQIVPGLYETVFIRAYAGNSASEGTEFFLSAYTTDDPNVYSYKNGIAVECIYEEDGSVQKTVRGTDCSGTITILTGEDGTTVLKWDNPDEENPISEQLIPVNTEAISSETETE